MSGYPGYQYPQHPQAMVPWAPPLPAPVQRPVLPPSPEGTAFAGALGAGAAALTTQGIMFLGNFQPKTLAANALITGAAAAFGGSAAALGYRMAGNRAYEAAQQAAGMAGVSPHQAAGSLRVNGKLGRFGQMEINIPAQTVLDAARAWQSIQNPNTPDVVNEYYRLAAENAAKMAAQGFVQYMPPPHVWAQPPAPPQWWQQAPPPHQPPPRPGT